MKNVLLLLCSLFIIQFGYSQENGIVNNSNTPFMQLKSIDIEDCNWTGGFWGNKVKQAHDVMIPNLGRLMDDPELIHAYDNFLVAADLKEGEFKGWSFHDGDFYKYVESLALQYAMTKDESIDARMDEIIEVIGQAQRPNGYLHTQIQIGHGVQGPHHESEHTFAKTAGPFEIDSKHEFYNFGHLMTAACIHYRATGKKNFLEIAIKASDLLYDKFKDPSPELAALDWNPPHYMGLVEMYRTTGDQRYLDLAETFIDMLGAGKNRKNAIRGLDHSQKRIPIRDETKAVGHAGHGNYMYSGVADVYSENGDQTLLLALERIWENITTKKMYLTGATGPQHFGVSQKKMVAEAYGKDYELPNLGAYNETCANIGNAMFNWRMFLLKGESRFMDIVELILYNSALSGIGLEGKDFFYTNPLRHIQGHEKNTKDEGLRSPYMSVFCCPPNIIRTIAQVNGMVYSTSDEGLWVNLYGSNTLKTEFKDGAELSVTQKTNYPWNGSIDLTIDKTEKNDFAIMLRIPSWASGSKIIVNGKSLKVKIVAGSYFKIKRSWKAGDHIELEIPIMPQLLEANPNIEETRNQVAIKRGPLVYCMESIDLPDGIKISEVVIPQGIKLKPRFGEGQLSDVVVLEGKAHLKSEKWSNELYRPLKRQNMSKRKIKLIPYFVWSNRGATDMTVWFPLKL